MAKPDRRCEVSRITLARCQLDRHGRPTVLRTDTISRHPVGSRCSPPMATCSTPADRARRRPFLENARQYPAAVLGSVADNARLTDVATAARLHRDHGRRDRNPEPCMRQGLDRARSRFAAAETPSWATTSFPRSSTCHRRRRVDPVEKSPSTVNPRPEEFECRFLRHPLRSTRRHRLHSRSSGRAWRSRRRIVIANVW